MSRKHRRHQTTHPVRLTSHVSRVMECRRTGHPAFHAERRVFIVGGKPHSFRVCVRCGSGIDPQAGGHAMGRLP
jgi:hypothetical protein